MLPTLHCTALLGIVPVGLYSSRNKHTASLHYLTEDTGNVGRYLHMQTSPPTNNGKFTAFVHTYLVIRKVHILCFVIVFSEKLLHSEEVGDGESARGRLLSTDRLIQAAAFVVLLLKVKTS